MPLFIEASQAPAYPLIAAPAQKVYVEHDSQLYQLMGTCNVAATGCKRIALICQALFLTIVTLGIALASATVRAHLQGKHLESLYTPAPPLPNLEYDAQQQTIDTLQAELTDLQATQDKASSHWLSLTHEIQALKDEIARLTGHVGVKINGQSSSHLAKELKALADDPFAGAGRVLSCPLSNSICKDLSLHITYNGYLGQFVLHLMAEPLSSRTDIMEYTVTNIATRSQHLMKQAWIRSFSSSDTDLGWSAVVADAQGDLRTARRPMINPFLTLDREESEDCSSAWLAQTRVDYEISFPDSYQILPFRIQINHPPRPFKTEDLLKIHLLIPRENADLKTLRKQRPQSSEVASA